MSLTYDGSSRAAGMKLFLDGAPLDVEIVRDQLYKQITGGGNDQITIGERFRDQGLTQGRVDEFRVFERELTAVEIKHLVARDSANDVSNAERAACSTEECFEHFLRHQQGYQEQWARLRTARERYNEQLDGFEEIMVMRESTHPRETFVLRRGAYDARGERVQPGTPAWLPPLGSDLPRNRLGLAKWLTHPEHPLAARVVVNRIWQLLFGEGLVRTPEDFGSQGTLPTHPELLDWLARDFIEHGWDTKWLMKQIMLSEVYQQTAVATAELLRTDPENRLYGRAPSYRWPAEMLRDQALLVGGVLVDRVGGAPAKPYELEESFKPSPPDDGQGLYRRSVYTYWKRTGPAPAMMALDAAKREVCRVKRSRTSSPLQALVLLNGPQFVEAARGLACRVMDEHDEPVAQLRTLFRTLTSQSPDDDELRVLRDLYEAQRVYFQADPRAAADYLAVGKLRVGEQHEPHRLAALASVANALFVFDECMMKH